MFKYIASVAAAAVTVNAAEDSFLSAPTQDIFDASLELQCQKVTTNDGAVFDITGLENLTNYVTSVDTE
jgi:hypothetical protein